ncbi:MAG: hypothetical protein K2M97_05480, partial [Muribaculaceae bacterium]|nr:hypothetical protein [Muribaculaceae bacterium]
MKLRLHNILKIESAEIELGGLTVLTGENNSGKSTVGKVLFSVLKAVNNARQIDRLKTVSLIRTELFSIKRMIHGSERLSALLDDLQSLSVNLADKSFPLEIFIRDLKDELALREDLPTRTKVMLLNRVNKIQQYII